MAMTFVQTRHTRVEESFEKGSVHFLKKAIIKDARLEFCDRLSFEEVQVLGRHNAGHQIRAFNRSQSGTAQTEWSWNPKTCLPVS